MNSGEEMTKAFRKFMLLVLVLCAVNSSYAQQTKRVNTDETTVIPEYIQPALDKNEPLISRVYEYTDVILIEKHGSEKGVNACFYIPVDSKGLKSEVEKVKWFGFLNDKLSREKIYSVTKNADETLVIALISIGFDDVGYYREELVVDRILEEKINDKTVVIRNTVPVSFFQSFNTGAKEPIPEIAEKIGKNYVRLFFEDGAIEDWILTPGKEDVGNNLRKFKEANRLLKWWNGVGKGSGSHDRHKSWNYNDNTESVPVYDKSGSD